MSTQKKNGNGKLAGLKTGLAAPKLAEGLAAAALASGIQEVVMPGPALDVGAAGVPGPAGAAGMPPGVPQVNGEVPVDPETGQRVRQANLAVQGALVNLGANAARRMMLDQSEVELLARGDKEQLRVLASQRVLLEREAGALFERLHQCEQGRMNLIGKATQDLGLNKPEDTKRYGFDLNKLVFVPQQQAVV